MEPCRQVPLSATHGNVYHGKLRRCFLRNYHTVVGIFVAVERLGRERENRASSQKPRLSVTKKRHTKTRFGAEGGFGGGGFGGGIVRRALA